MKTKILSIVTLSILQLSMYGCTIRGSGIVTSEERQLVVFTGINLKNSANVFITQGTEQKVRIEAENNIIQHITTEVKNNSLNINTDEDITTNSPINIYITIKDLTKLHLSGSGNITMSDKIKCSNLEMRLDGSGDIHGTFESKLLSILLSGSGNLDLKGKTDEATIRINGSGSINGKDFEIQSCNIQVSGSGTSIIDVKDNLTATLNGSGNVYYLDDPSRMEVRTNGSGICSRLKTTRLVN